MILPRFKKKTLERNYTLEDCLQLPFQALLPSLPSECSIAKPHRVTCPSQNTSFTTLWLSWPFFSCNSVPKVWIPSTCPLSPSITSCVSYLCALKPHRTCQPEPWLPFSRLHSIFFILFHSHLPCCIFMLLSPTWHCKNLESRLVTFYTVNLKFIPLLFGYSKSSKYCGKNKLKLKFFLPLKYSIILFSWASATY